VEVCTCFCSLRLRLCMVSALAFAQARRILSRASVADKETIRASRPCREYRNSIQRLAVGFVPFFYFLCQSVPRLRRDSAIHGNFSSDFDIAVEISWGINLDGSNFECSFGYLAR